MPSSCSSRRSVESMQGSCQPTTKRRAAGASLASALLPPLGKADLELLPQHERGHPTNQQEHVLHCLGHDCHLPSRRYGVIFYVGPSPTPGIIASDGYFQPVGRSEPSDGNGRAAPDQVESTLGSQKGAPSAARSPVGLTVKGGS